MNRTWRSSSVRIMEGRAELPSPKKRTPLSRLPSVTPQQAKMIFPLPGGEILGVVNALCILDAHFLQGAPRPAAC